MGVRFSTVVHFLKYRNAGLSGIWAVRYRNEKKADAVTSPLPEKRGFSSVLEGAGTGMRCQMAF
jgi:hypothetical protein